MLFTLKGEITMFNKSIKVSSEKEFFKKTMFLLVFCFLLRITFFYIVRPWNIDYLNQKLFFTDASFYHDLAKNILESNNLLLTNLWSSDPYRMPFYPFFISLFYYIFGIKPWIILIFQIILNTLSCLFLMLAAKRFLSEKTVFVIGIFFALDPFFILYSSILVTETVFVFWIILSFYYLVLFLDKRKSHDLVISSIYMGISTLTRPTSQFIPILVSIFLLVFFRSDIKNTFKNICIYLSLFFLIICPWLVRNYINFNSVSLSAAASKSFVELYIAPIIMEKERINYNRANRLLLDDINYLMVKDDVDPNRANDFIVAKYRWKIGTGYIIEEPKKFIKFYFLGIIHSLFNLETSLYTKMIGLNGTTVYVKCYGDNLSRLIKDFIRYKSWQEILIGSLIFLFLLVSYLFLILGLIVCWDSYNRTFLIACILIAGYFIIITGSAGFARYKIPSIPFYLIFVGIGCEYILENIKKIRQ